MKKILPFILLTSLFASCHYINQKKIRGNGTIKTENRSTGNFTSVDVSGSIDVYIKQDSTNSVKVEADENLQEYIIITTEGDDLVIEPKEGYNPSGHIKVYVSSPNYKSLEASGACKIIGDNKISSSNEIEIDLRGASHVDVELKAPKVDAGTSGAGTVTLRGETKDLYVHGSGSSTIRCADLMAENVDVSISGAGNAQVYASVKLDVGVSGAGNVKYRGNASVTKSISGAGSVSKMD